MAFNATAVLEALKEIEVLKGISQETVINALTESIIKAFKKEIGGDDAIVRVTLDPENNIFEMLHIKNIVEVVEDDFLEITREEALELASNGQGYVEGDEYIVPATVDQMKKATALSVKATMKQKFADAEKSILYEAFKDKLGTLITGRVEKADERGVSVNIGRSSVYLPKAALIGDERFSVGDPIKLYVDRVESSTKSGARVNVTRANDGFLRCLFFEEIHEVFDGTILIKSIAREAGERSKVAVYSVDPNVDPAGACIGPNGSRIQKIVGQLGNGSAREKIDIIAYSENAGLYVMEALKPAKVAGIIVNTETKSATVVVKDDSLSLAIGRRGVNARLAVKLTGYNIDIKTESVAIEEGLTYQTFEELEALEVAERNRRAMELAAARRSENESVLPVMPEGYVAPQERVYEDEADDRDEALHEQVYNEDYNDVPVAEEVAPAESPVEEAAPAVEEAPVAEPAQAEEAPVEVTETVAVQTTTTMDELENSLNSSKKGNKQTKKKFGHKKKEETEEEDSKGITDTSSGQRMAIYTEEELRELDEEEAEDSYEEDEVDYDDYDDYYDK